MFLPRTSSDAAALEGSATDPLVLDSSAADVAAPLGSGEVPEAVAAASPSCTPLVWNRRAGASVADTVVPSSAARTCTVGVITTAVSPMGMPVSASNCLSNVAMRDRSRGRSTVAPAPENGTGGTSASVPIQPPGPTSRAAAPIVPLTTTGEGDRLTAVVAPDGGRGVVSVNR